MNQELLESIRKAERDSHIEIYSTAKLFEEGSWLQKPVKTVMDLLPEFETYSKIKMLDLGCGVGRNCIPAAQYFTGKECSIDCIDILEFAIEELNENAKEFGVEKSINGMAVPIEQYKVQENKYDFIFAVSALEHIDSEESFIKKLSEIEKGIKENGIVCLIINSEVSEINKNNGNRLNPQFEVNLKTEKLSEILNKIFADWEILKYGVRNQRYDIPRNGCIADLTTSVVTFVAKKKNSGLSVTSPHLSPL